MSTVEVKVATNIRASGPNPVTLYTVPAGKQAVVRTVNINNTAQTSTAINPTLSLRRSGSITALSTTNIAATASANMLTAPITMISGDELVTTETTVDGFGEVVTALFPDGTNTAAVAIVDSNTIICCNASGIYRSTNAGVTFTQVSSLSCSTSIAAKKIGTDYFIYQSRTSAYRSTDSGVTWTTQAVTNAPDVAGGIGRLISAPGRIVFNGTVYGGLTTNAQLSTTTDGITWTNATPFPSSVNCLVWSGTHWVAGRDNTDPSIYRSTDGVTWSTVAARTAGFSNPVGGLATDGAGVIITGSFSPSTVIGRSTDHGATWSDQQTGFSVTTSTNTPPVNYIGGNFYVFTNSTNTANYSPTGIAGSFVTTGALSIFSGASSDSYGVNGTNVFYTLRGLRKCTLTPPTVYAGMDVTAAILEVTP